MIIRIFYLVLLASTILMFLNCRFQVKSENSLNGETITLEVIEKDRRVDIYAGEELFTSYMFSDDMEKPVLYPVMAHGKIPVTRGFPLEPREGERIDHPHHVGLWFNFGDVNGLDFWNNSYQVPLERKAGYGKIVHQKILHTESENNKGILQILAEWQTHDGEMLLSEETTFVFQSFQNRRSIIRITKLKCVDQKITFTDNKEGLFAIRVSREFEAPSKSPIKVINSAGQPLDTPVIDNTYRNGVYFSSNGSEGEEVWGTRGDWVTLTSKIDDREVSLTIFDHPDNPGYPAYWHARGYGLFSVNNLGHYAFNEVEPEIIIQLNPGESITFRHQLIVNSGEQLPAEELKNLF